MPPTFVPTRFASWAPARVLFRIARLCPTTEDELLAISGFGPVMLEKYGEEILAICINGAA